MPPGMTNLLCASMMRVLGVGGGMPGPISEMMPSVMRTSRGVGERWSALTMVPFCVCVCAGWGCVRVGVDGCTWSTYLDQDVNRGRSTCDRLIIGEGNCDQRKQREIQARDDVHVDVL